ncbi:hypothetical protein DV737_g4649, partial [Chaetothyriales sp. CBS 132003]
MKMMNVFALGSDNVETRLLCRAITRLRPSANEALWRPAQRALAPCGLQGRHDNPNAAALFPVSVKLPHAPYTMKVMVSSQEQVQDVRQSIVETPDTFQYTCFHLEHNGQRVNDFVELSEVSDIKPGSELVLVEDAYSEKESRMHVVRVRELIGAAGDRSEQLHGIAAGLSLYDERFGAGNSGGGAAHEDNGLAGYDLAGQAVLSTLLPASAADSLPRTVKSLGVSAWNPPPLHLRQRGHLLYLQVTTNEGEQYFITGAVSGFFVNKCSSNKFDPFPRAAPKNHAAHSLLSLISMLSPSFNDTFAELQKINGQKDLLTTFPFQNAMPANPWLLPPSVAANGQHQADLTRSQEAYLLGGTDGAENLRDWNEEFQTTKELPRDTLQDRVFRERLTAKLFADYTDAATRGAVLVARGEVAPLNPTEGRDAQIFIYNNIFYSYGCDGVQTFASEGGDEAARVAVGKDVAGVKAVNQLDINGLFTPGTVVVDYVGKRIVAQSIVPGIFKQREPGEHQIDYGGVEGRESIAENEAFVPVFEKLSTALRVKKHPVWDKDGKRHDLEASVETKGLLGTDGRKYVLDLYRITPLDAAWAQDVEGLEGDEKYPHKMSVLRLELVEMYWRMKMQEYVKAESKAESTAADQVNGEDGSKVSDQVNGEDGSKASDQVNGEDGSKANGAAEAARPEPDKVDLSAFTFALNPDACSGQLPQTEAEKAEYAEDEKEVRAVCAYLRGKVLPGLIRDLFEGDVGFPMDGQSLCQLMHKRGINIRYLGRLAQLAEEQGKRLQAFYTVALQEMVARAFKHVVNGHLRPLAPVFVASCIAHLLNCLLGSAANASPRAEVDAELRELYAEGEFSFEKVSPRQMASDIAKQVKLRYRFTLPDQWQTQIRPWQLLREVSLKLGLQLPCTTFVVDDVLNVTPLVKDAAPRSTLAEEALEAGKISLAQGQKQLGQELVLESLSLHEQIYGILHPEVAKMYQSLSTIYYQTDEKEAAVELARKAVILTERTMGVDSNDTILAYLNLSLFEHHVGNTRQALKYVKHALDVWKIVYGPNHPDSITTINNAAVMLQSLKEYQDSRKWFEACYTICEQLFGKQSVNAATILFQLAQALALDADAKGAVAKMRDAYNIFLAELGPNDRNTKEAESWLEQLTQNAVAIARQAKDMQARRLRAVRLLPRVGMETRLQPQSAHSATSNGTAAAAGHGPSPTGSVALDSRSIEELIKYIEGADSSTRSKVKNQLDQRRRCRQHRSAAKQRATGLDHPKTKKVTLHNQQVTLHSQKVTHSRSHPSLAARSANCTRSKTKKVRLGQLQLHAPPMLGDLLELATTVVHPGHQPDIAPAGGRSARPSGSPVATRRARSRKSTTTGATATAPSPPPPESLPQRLQSLGRFVGAVALSLALELLLNTVALQTSAKTELADISQTEPTGSQIVWLLAEKLALLAVFWFGHFDAYDVASLTLLSTTPISILLAFFYSIHGATLATKTAISITAHTVPYLAIFATTVELALISFLPVFLATRFSSLRTLEFAHQSATAVVLPTLLVALLPAGYAATELLFQVLVSRAVVLAVVLAVETVVFAVGQLQGVEWQGALGYAGLWVASVAVVAAALDWVGK